MSSTHPIAIESAQAPTLADVDALPFIKWVGGKRWLCQKHARLLPDPRTVRTLGVPFVGGGAIVYHYAAACVSSWCSDTNEHLVGTYLVVRDHVEAYGGDDADAWWDDRQADAVEARAGRVDEARREPGRQMTWTW